MSQKSDFNYILFSFHALKIRNDVKHSPSLGVHLFSHYDFGLYPSLYKLQGKSY